MKSRNLNARQLSGAAFALLALLLTVFPLDSAVAQDPAIPSGDIRIHYFRPDGNYSGWTVYAFDRTTENTGDYGGGPVQVTGTDSYGVYFDVGVMSGAQEVGIIIHNPTAAGGDQKDTPNNLFVDPSTQGNEYWAYSGIAKLYNTAINVSNPTALLPGYVRVHYYRTDGNYTPGRSMPSMTRRSIRAITTAGLCRRRLRQLWRVFRCGRDCGCAECWADHS